MSNADCTRARERSKRDRTLEELAYANVRGWNFFKLVALVCAGHNDKDDTAN